MFLSCLDGYLSSAQGDAAGRELCWQYLAFPHVMQVHLVEIDIAQDSQIAEAAGVQSTPTVQMFKAKERIHHLPCVKMKSEYLNLISSALE